MGKVKSGLMAVWKTVYPLMAYYISVFSVGEVFAALQIQPSSSVMVILPGALLTAGILWFPYKRDWILRSGQIRTFKPQIPKDWHHLIILGISASIGANLLLSFTPLSQWFPGVEESIEQIDSAGFLLQLFGVCLIIPVTEELVFRGIGYWGLRDEMGPILAAVCSSVFFGLFHGNLVQGIYAAALGLILAWVMEQYQTLTSVCLVHAAMNLGSIYVLNGILFPMTEGNLPIQIAVAVPVCGVLTAELYRLKGLNDRG